MVNGRSSTYSLAFALLLIISISTHSNLLMIFPLDSSIMNSEITLNDPFEIIECEKDGRKTPHPNITDDCMICLHVGELENKSTYTGSPSRAETREFEVLGGTITAELRRTGEHCYLYVEEGYIYYPENVVREFDTRIFPEISTRMGEPNDVDGDPKIFLLYYNMGNNGIAGYFRPSDPNQLDIIYFNLIYNVGSDVVAHEFTHLTQHNYDEKEERWVDEGLAEVAKMHLYGNPRNNSFMRYFEHLNTIPLNWKQYSDDPNTNRAQYGIAYVFQQYIYDRYQGIDSSGLVLRDGYSFDPGNNTMHQGIRGIINFLDLVNSSEDFTSLFRNWTVANLIDNPLIGNGTWGYDNLDIAVRPTVFVDSTPFDDARNISAFSPNYIQVNRTERPAEVTITAGNDMSVAMIHESAQLDFLDFVEIRDLNKGINILRIDTDDENWEHITLDIINHKDDPDSYHINITEIEYKPPVAIACDDIVVVEGETMVFSAAASYHPEGRDILQYLWDFDRDGIFDSEGIEVNFTYDVPGNYTVLLEIVDDEGLNATDTVNVTVEKKSTPPIIVIRVSKKQPLIFENVTLDASNTTDPEGDELNFSWDIDGDEMPDQYGRCRLNPAT